MPRSKHQLQLAATENGCNQSGAAGRPGPAWVELSSKAVPPTRFCTRCGGPIQTGDRFCGRCGAPVHPSDGEDTAAWSQEDPLAEWGLDQDDAAERPEDERDTDERPTPSPPHDEAPTERVPLLIPDQTAVIQQPEPYLPPAAERPVPHPPPEQPPGSPPPSPGFPVGATVALVGAMAVVASAILPWDPGLVLGLGGALPRDIAFRALLTEAASGPTLGIALLVMGMAGALMALVTMVLPWLKFARRLLGLLQLAVPVMVTLRMLDPLLAQGALGRLPRSLGVGVYMAAAGALVQVVAGRWFRA
jgi:hypothetical protein